MAKKDIQTPRTPTRKQVARSKKEREQLRLIYMGLGLVAVLIVIVLAFGLLQTYVIEPGQAVAVVNGQEITRQAYRNRVRYERFILEDIYQQIVTEFQALPPASDEGDQFTELLRNQYQQQASQVLQQRSVVDRQTLDIMMADKLIEAEAQARNITVSEEDVTEAINRFLAGREGGLTAQAAAETSTARAEASVTAASWTPTPTFTPSPTLTTTTEITPTTPTSTPAPLPTPTFNIVDDATLTTQYTNWLNTLAESADTDEAQYRQIIRASLLRDKVREAIGDEVPPTAEQARARHILVETEDEAKEVIERLAAGEDFADLAGELSQDTGSAVDGGDLGFAPPGRYVPEFEEAVQTLSIGQVSDPVESQFGWHIIEVLEREERELSPVDYAQLQRTAFSDWLEETREAADIEDTWTPDVAPADSFLNQL